MAEDRRIRKTNAAIFEALQRLVERMPLAQVTMSALAAEADVTRKTLYAHFPTVTDAYQAMIDDMMARLARRTEEDWRLADRAELDLGVAGEVEARLFLFLGNVREVIQGQQEGSLRRRRFVTHEELYGYILGPLTRSIEDGLLGAPARFQGNEGLVASFVLAGTLWAYRRWMDAPAGESLVEVQTRACGLLMRGIGSLFEEEGPLEALR